VQKVSLKLPVEGVLLSWNVFWVIMHLLVLVKDTKFWKLPLLPESESYVTTDGQSASLSWNKAPIWGLWPDFLLLSDSCFAGLLMWVDVRSLWREDGSAVCNCCWPSPAQSFSGASPVGLATIFYCFRFETSFSSPPTTRRATVEVFDPASTRDPLLPSPG
jgi:hypothetical protein